MKTFSSGFSLVFGLLPPPPPHHHHNIKCLWTIKGRMTYVLHHVCLAGLVRVIHGFLYRLQSVSHLVFPPGGNIGSRDFLENSGKCTCIWLFSNMRSSHYSWLSSSVFVSFLCVSFLNDLVFTRLWIISIKTIHYLPNFSWSRSFSTSILTCSSFCSRSCIGVGCFMNTALRLPWRTKNVVLQRHMSCRYMSVYTVSVSKRLLYSRTPV